MPMAFATGAGEATNRATLNNQQQILELTLEDIVKKTISTFTKYILRRIQNKNGAKDIPKVIWGDVRAEEKNDKTKRLQAYKGMGAISYIKVEGLYIGRYTFRSLFLVLYSPFVHYSVSRSPCICGATRDSQCRLVSSGRATQ